MSKKRSKNEIVANKISEMVNDLTLDLDQIGTYIAQEPTVTYRRVVEIAEAAKYEREEQEIRF